MDDGNKDVEIFSKVSGWTVVCVGLNDINSLQ